MNKLSISQKSYIAGFLDADGMIGISRVKSKSNAHPYSFTIRVIITNTNYEVIKYFKKTIGVGCAYESSYKYKPNWNVVHRYQLQAKQSFELLTEIIDFLIVKKERAETVLQIPHQGHLGKQRSQTDYDRQEQLFFKLKSMNIRGKSTVDSDN